MKFVFDFDNHLLEYIFQPFADWLVARTGKSCFWFSAQCFVIGLLAFLISIVPHVPEQPVMLSVCILVQLTVFGGFYVCAMNAHRRWLRRNGEAAANPYRIKYFIWRFQSIVILVIFDCISHPLEHMPALWSAESLVQDSMFLIGLYLLACIAMPPPKLHQCQTSFAWKPA